MRYAAVLIFFFGCVDNGNQSDAALQGEEGGPCYANGTCNAGLVCVVPNKCVRTDADVPETSADVSTDVATDSPAVDAGPCPSTGLLAWWKGEGNANDTQNFLPLSPKFGVSYTSAHTLQGFLLAGTDYLEATGANAQLPGLGAITIEGWVQPSNVGSPMTIFSRRASGASPPGFAFYLSGGKLTYVSGTTIVTGNGTIAASTAHHVAVTCDGNNVTFYLDGAPDGGGAAAVANDPIDALVGASWAPAQTTANNFSGWIDELAIYSKALTNTQITTLKGGGAKCN